jgi:hypothetical protein
MVPFNNITVAPPPPPPAPEKVDDAPPDPPLYARSVPGVEKVCVTLNPTIVIVPPENTGTPSKVV